jgi:hypothetical protein
MEATAWIKYITTILRVILPKRLTILMQRPDWVKWVKGDSNNRGLLGKEKHEIINFQEI